MKLYRARNTTDQLFYEKQADVPKGTKFETVEFAFAASPKADFVTWLNERDAAGLVDPWKGYPWKGHENDPMYPLVIEPKGVAQPQPKQPDPAHAAQIIAFEDAFEAMPLPTQLHYAGLALENARSQIGASPTAPARQVWGGGK
jgi:hypothetical protein